MVRFITAEYTRSHTHTICVLFRIAAITPESRSGGDESRGYGTDAKAPDYRIITAERDRAVTLQQQRARSLTFKAKEIK